jgi:hypothetical protein
MSSEGQPIDLEKEAAVIKPEVQESATPDLPSRELKAETKPEKPLKEAGVSASPPLSPTGELFVHKTIETVRESTAPMQRRGWGDTLLAASAGALTSLTTASTNPLAAPGLAAILGPAAVGIKRITSRFLNEKHETDARLFVNNSLDTKRKWRKLTGEGFTGFSNRFILGANRADQVAQIKPELLSLRSDKQLEQDLFDALSAVSFKAEIDAVANGRGLNLNTKEKVRLTILEAAAQKFPGIVSQLETRHEKDAPYMQSLLHRVQAEVAKRRRTRWIKGVAGKMLDSIWPAAIAAGVVDLVSGKTYPAIKQGVENVYNGIRGEVESVATGVKNAVESTAHWISDTAVPAVKGFFDSVGTSIGNAGTEIGKWWSQTFPPVVTPPVPNTPFPIQPQPAPTLKGFFDNLGTGISNAWNHLFPSAGVVPQPSNCAAQMVAPANTHPWTSAELASLKKALPKWVIPVLENAKEVALFADP